MNETTLKNAIVLLFILTAISAVAANYPTYYAMYYYGPSAFFSGVSITQYSIRMSLLILAAVLIAILNVFLIRKYLKDPDKKRRITILLSLAVVFALLLDYPTYYVAYHYGIKSVFRGVPITHYSTVTTAILALMLIFLASSFLVFVRTIPKRAESVEEQKQSEILTQAELLRVRLWRSRAQNSRLLGLVMLILSAGLFILAYETLALVYELGSLAAFIIGAALILTQLEPRIKLYPASDASLGSLLALSNIIRQHYGDFKAVFVSDFGGDHMQVMKGEDNQMYSSTLEPVGEGLVRSYERELGDLNGKGEDYIESWLVKTITQGLGLAESAKINFEDGEMQSVLDKPFVRSLCVQEQMTKSVCSCMGCPLIASIAQSAAKATGKKIVHVECRYDPSTQRAISRHKVQD
jgi:hypothetical protein